MAAGFEGLRRLHRGAALLALNTLVALLVLEGILAIGLRFVAREGEAVQLQAERAKMAALRAVYPGRSEDDIIGLWRETMRPLVYEPFVEFREAARAGRWVNVSEQGFRVGKDQCAWPIDRANLNVFVFGGSTTFGYGVADDETWPSRLQERWAEARRSGRVCVYNFGRGFYYSSQERVLFERLLLAGHVPAVAVFMDGLNDFCFPEETTAVSPRLAGTIREDTALTRLESLANIVARSAIGRTARLVAGARPAELPVPNLDLEDAAAIRRAIARYRANARMIESVARLHAVEPVFVWQPVPTYKYDLEQHLFANDGFGNYVGSRAGYPAMAEEVRVDPPSDHFVWLADLQEDAREPLYVDLAHYTAKFSAEIASELARRLDGLGILDR